MMRDESLYPKNWFAIGLFENNLLLCSRPISFYHGIRAFRKGDNEIFADCKSADSENSYVNINRKQEG